MSSKSPLKSKNVQSTCYCENNAKLEYVTASSGCSEDFAAVCALPDQWVPRTGGPILANYLKQRETSHMNVYEDLLKQSKILNEEVDTKVRTLAEILLAAIQQNQRDIDCVIEKFVPNENSLTVEEHKHAMSLINDLLSQRIQDLINFKLGAFTLERERSTKLKSILKVHFQRAVAVGHKSPKDLLHEFDEKIYDINQQLMSNSRTYVVLEAKLRSQADESLIQARSKLNRLFFVTKSVLRAQSAQPWSREQSNKASGDSRQSPIDPGKIGETKQIKLVDEYRKVISNIFTAIADQFDDLHREIIENNDMTRECSNSEINEFQKIVEKGIHSLGFSAMSKEELLNRSATEISRSGILNMQKCLSVFGENLKQTYLILHDASHVWDAHMLRHALAQKITIASVEDLIVSHDAMELGNEVVTDICLEQLRASPDVDKLNQFHDVILTTLDRTMDLYKQHNEAEVGKLEEFTTLTSFLTNTLLAEHNLFLEKNPRLLQPEIKSTVKTPVNGSPRNTEISRRSPVSKPILLSEIQNVALCKWRNGFLESFETNTPMVSEKLIHQIQLWIDDRRDILEMRHSLKLLSHSIRKERIATAHEMRLAEIRYHEARLNSHLDAIYDLVDNVPMEASEFLSLDDPQLYPLYWWLSGIQTDMNNLLTRDPLDPEAKRLKMCSYAARLSRHRQHFLESLDIALEQYKKSVVYKVQVARISNVRFMSELKLFSEGGKFAAAEAMKACTMIVRGADALEACFSRTVDCINHRRAQLLSLADQQISPIQKTVDESLKNAAKGFLAKKTGTGKK